MSLPIITIFSASDTLGEALDSAAFEIRSVAMSDDARVIEDAIASSDGIVVDGNGALTWYIVAIALEKYGRPTALIGTGNETFAASLARPTFLMSADAESMRAFFTKHFPPPVDPTCTDDVCRV